MTDSHSTIVAKTPAKLNLGLEIVHRRADGLHEIVTILQAISIYDEFHWSPRIGRFHYAGIQGISLENDLVYQALSYVDSNMNWRGSLSINKVIPKSAGLGGGSSDAALALRLRMNCLESTQIEIEAAALGTDVPFFLKGGTALATGTGTQLSRLPTPNMWFAVVSPRPCLVEKTRTLYLGLTEADMSDGSQVRLTARRIESGASVTGALPNAFSRQMLRHEAVMRAWTALERAGAKCVALSGSGPTVFATVHEKLEAEEIISRLPTGIGRCFVASSVSEHALDSNVESMSRALCGK